ncbi:MAG TPA: TIGR03087 family PEP-CTERM/XrtA system glycosyltransferase [Rhodanobacteraceae bacterium]|nr:TIGR03087 family PEP-CTERM/XrtA system glycosyltransferase [Rhodanobacteraceae bacterium]
MQSALFLCHRLPWPPDKGDKIRSYHVLRRLARHYKVYLGTFVDDPADWRHLAEVEAVCAGACVRPLPAWRARWRALGSLARREPLTVGCYRDPVLRRWVRAVLAEQQPEVVLCFSSGVAPLVMQGVAARRVMDFVDADSDKWHQYAEAHRGLARLVYQREARKLARFERTIATRFEASLFVSEAEAAFFRNANPGLAERVHGLPNGVDAAYWNPARAFTNPYRPGERVVVFTGAMDYRANADAVTWFADAVWPRVLAGCANARFYIVGSNPAREVLALGRRAGITVTGRVDDVRPFLAHAHVVAAPLRIARGIQNKVLEALAMEKVVLATPEAWEGISDFAGRQGCISGSPEAMVAEALQWLDTPQPVRVPAARAMVRQRYDWTRNLDAYERVLRGAQHDAIDGSLTSVRAEACA